MSGPFFEPPARSAAWPQAQAPAQAALGPAANPECSAQPPHGRGGLPSWLAALGAGLLDATIPQTCVACGSWISGAAPLCGGCAARLDALQALPACDRCGRVMRPESIRPGECARCSHESFWNVRAVVRLGPDVAPLRGLLRLLKYAGEERVALPLCDRLAARLAACDWWPQVDVLVPVPMHRLRRWQRPCDHAWLLAEGLSRRLRVPLRRAAIRRHRYAPSQTGASSRARRFEQVSGCFVTPPRPRIAGLTICIVDNLLVSGATICEVSKVLRAAGVRRIYAAVAARTMPPGDFQAAEALLNDWISRA